MKATWKGKTIAESNDTIVIEGNYYFPPESISKEFFKPSETHSVCPWKGMASYYHLEVDGAINEDAAWFYPEAKEPAKGFQNYLAFWKGVEIVE